MPSDPKTDEQHIERAIELARRGAGDARPNPVVGAVVARGSEVIGEGWHREYGGPHAEVNAIAACGTADLSDTTMYISLEPCCHEGKTPPCTDAIVGAGIRRVVVASDDPSDKASGRGLGILRDEGIEVVAVDGDLAHQARLLNQAFRKHARTGRPWVLFKSAMTLDGKVATSSGDSQWISGEQSRELAHQWRATVDAVVVGIGTARADDPLLTARPAGGTVERQPRRVVFDSLARLSPESQLVAGAERVPVTVIVSRAAARADIAALQAAGVEIIVATGENEPARVVSGLEQLGERDITAVLLEGGPHLAGAFLDAGEIDELRLFLAPMLLGGSAARDPLEGGGVDRIAEAVRALTLDVERVAEDLLIKARLREW